MMNYEFQLSPNEAQSEYKIDINKKRIDRRILINNISKKVFFLSMIFALMVLGLLLYRIGVQSMGWLDIQFLSGRLSRFPEKAGIWGAIVGSLGLIAVVIPVTLVIGALLQIDWMGNTPTILKRALSSSRHPSLGGQAHNSRRCRFVSNDFIIAGSKLQ